MEVRMREEGEGGGGEGKREENYLKKLELKTSQILGEIRTSR